MRKLNIILLLSVIFSLLALPTLGTISTITINTPPTNTETAENSFLFNASVTWTDPTNLTNLTFWAGSTQLGTNSTLNGSRTTATSGHFTFQVDLTTLADGTYTVVAEARNTTDQQAGTSLNSSGITLIVDNAVPSCRTSIDTYRINPFNSQRVDCSRTFDNVGNLNTSSFRIFIIDPSDERVTKSGTSGRADFDGTETQLKGLYTAGCHIRDNAGNLCTNVTDVFIVSSSDKEAEDIAEEAGVKPRIDIDLTWFYIGIIMFALVVVIVALLIIIPKMKKK